MYVVEISLVAIGGVCQVTFIFCWSWGENLSKGTSFIPLLQLLQGALPLLQAVWSARTRASAGSGPLGDCRKV